MFHPPHTTFPKPKPLQDAPYTHTHATGTEIMVESLGPLIFRPSEHDAADADTVRDSKKTNIVKIAARGQFLSPKSLPM